MSTDLGWDSLYLAALRAAWKAYKTERAAGIVRPVARIAVAYWLDVVRAGRRPMVRR